MKKLVLILLFTAIGYFVTGQVSTDQGMTQMAMKYFNTSDYQKAASIFKSIYETTGNGYYFRFYINCLTELQQFSLAEEEIKKEIRRKKNLTHELYIHYGYVLKMQKRMEEAEEKFNEAIRLIPVNKVSYINAANMFLHWREYENAEKTYLYAEKALNGEPFHRELAQIYLNMRNYSQLIDKVLELAGINEANLPMVQSYLMSALYSDVDNNMRDIFRAAILKRIQSEPTVLGFPRLLIWFFTQERQFRAALQQAIALDRRTNKEMQQILGLAQMALQNQNFQEASSAYQYLLAKGKENPGYSEAFMYKLHSDYLQFTSSKPDPDKGKELQQQFDEGMEILGYSAPTVFLIREYAHLLAFYLKETEKAIRILEKGVAIPALRPLQSGELKTELADIYVFANDPYEALLLYSQVIDANRDNPLGDDVKLKKARLGYLMGNFSWARAQLDVIKASTSKLTANDAMELALFIENNANMDSTEAPLRSFARADLHFFRNEDDKALAILDSIKTQYPYHALTDDILFRKAKIGIRKNNYQEAVTLLEQIVDEFSTDLLADDALFMLAEILHYQLNDKEKASGAYKKMLFSYPGSIYVTEARNRYRELTGHPDEMEILPEKGKEILP